MKASVAVLLSGLLLGQSMLQYVRTKTEDGQHCFRWAVAAGARGTVAFVQSTEGLPSLGAGVFDAVSRSAQPWQAQLQACGNLDLAEGNRSSSRTIGYAQSGPNENLILFRTRPCSAVVPAGDPCVAAGSCGNAYDCWDHSSSIVALTTSSYVTTTGVVLDADVELNAATAYPTIVDSPPCAPGAISTGCVANDVQNAMTHELGHVLGLAHAPDSSSTMYANEPLGETSKRVLDSGSKQFVCDVYPAGRASNDCASSSAGSTSSGCSGAPDGGSVTPLLALLLGVFALRPRRRGV